MAAASSDTHRRQRMAPSTPTLVNGGTVAVCTGSTATFTVQNPLPNTTYRWYDAAMNGNLLQNSASPTFTTRPSALTAEPRCVC